MNTHREEIIEPPPCSRVVNNGSGGRGSRRAIGTAGGVAPGRSSLFFKMVVMMVSAMMEIVHSPGPVAMVVILLFEFE